MGYLVDRQGRPDHRLGVADPEIGREAVAIGRAALAPSHGRLQGGSQGSAGVSGGRMNVRTDSEIPDDLGIRRAIERDAAGEAKIFCLVLVDKLHQDLTDGDFEGLLHRRGQILMLLAHLAARRARRNSEVLDQGRSIMPLRRAEIEEPLIKRKSPVRADPQNGTDQLVKISGFAIGGQPHNLVFSFVYFKSQVIGKYRVEQSQRMREMN